ncbi:glycosyltransferase family 2 protein [Diaphorobacter sp. HDW4B]|uniref:glycosyltransferase family 2 protein n=1 Tax=Diaphorobacter sp. HDW4B TaxID=2714925 RepID=UPI0014094972|nr:glycosyltransferase family 2 protein [Diaphorobacter sp. HDW4B]QIL70093.1 glycosyltransferase family 2 protein [Diaphorobacter sp. HDW4B]
MKCSIVIPVYNSEKILPELLKQLNAELEKLGLLGDSELILVNDSSPDGSWDVLRSLTQLYPNLKAVNLAKNFGQHNAIMAGLQFASGDNIVLMDDDLQHSPAYIGDLLQALEKDDVCFVRFEKRQHAGWKVAGSNFNNLLASHLVEKPKDLYLSSFKAFRKHIRAAVVQYEGPYPYIDGLILRSTNRIHVIDAVHRERFTGQGNYNLKRSVSLLMKMATGFSVAPLRLAIIIGVVFGLLSLLTVVYVIVDKLMNPSVQPGWTSIVAIVLAVSGIQMLFLGLIGEYMGRLYLNINKKPQFVVREISGFSGLKKDE